MVMAWNSGIEVAMNESESMGRTGWGLLAILLLGVLATLTFGIGAAFYWALILVPVVFVALILLCSARDAPHG